MKSEVFRTRKVKRVEDPPHLRSFSSQAMAVGPIHAHPRYEAFENVLLCPMPGLVVEVRVRKGDRVFRGQDLVSIESMKMESFVASPCDGEVEEVLVAPGQTVEADDVLVRFRA